jgi:hypothetical protein
MKIIGTWREACLMTLMFVATSVLAASNKDVAELMSRDGLQKISVKGIDLVYARPGASLAGFKRVKLEPVDVEFRKSWDPARTGSAIKLSSEEREKIRSGVARVVQEEFAKELQKNSTFQIASEAGPDVLRVKARIVDLYVNAPDVGVGRSRTIVSSAGEMTLVAELYDSATGQVLARVADRREANAGGRMHLSNGMVNEEEARKIAAGWARLLRKSLDKAHGVGK